MKTLILNGSPHRNGDTAALVAVLKETLGGELIEVNAYSAKIAPCVDCRACWKKPGCVIRDEMDQVYRAMDECDAVVVASPIYFSMLTGPLLSLASRLQAIYTARRFLKVDLRGKKKVGGVLMTGGGDGSFHKALEMAECMLRFMGAASEGYAAALHTDDCPAAQDAEALEAVRELARKIRERIEEEK